MCPQSQMPRSQTPLLTNLHTPLINSILSLLSLQDVLRFEQSARSCQHLVQNLPAPAWKAILGNWLPAHHALLDSPSRACGRTSYCRSQRDLWKGVSSERCAVKLLHREHGV